LITVDGDRQGFFLGSSVISNFTVDNKYDGGL
jgi:hypothetical protein